MPLDLSPAIRAEGISFAYPGSPLFAKLRGKEGAVRKALDDISFEIGTGEVFGVLGPNGAGKTTLMKILGTILLPSSGSLSVFGEKLPGGEARVRASLGVSLGEYERAFSWRLTGRQNLAYMAAFYGIPRSQVKERVAEALETVALTEKADKLFQEYSTGMKHRLALARALLPKPRLLILDEPTAGLDAKTSHELAQTIRHLATEGVTIVYTTHRLEEAATLCDRVLILKEGKRAAMAAPWELARLVHDVLALEITVKGVVPPESAQMESLPAVRKVVLTGRSTLRIQVADLDRALPDVVEWLRIRGAPVMQVQSAGANLADAFIAITEGRISGAAAAASAPQAAPPEKRLVEFQAVRKVGP